MAVVVVHSVVAVVVVHSVVAVVVVHSVVEPWSIEASAVLMSSVAVVESTGMVVGTVSVDGGAQREQSRQTGLRSTG
jgi:hypothetical protein